MRIDDTQACPAPLGRVVVHPHLGHLAHMPPVGAASLLP